MHRLSRILSALAISAGLLMVMDALPARADSPSSAVEAVVSTQAQEQGDKSLEPQADTGEAVDLGTQSDAGRNMYRLYNPHSGEHFYTANVNEARNVFFAGWAWEGIGWVAPTSGQDVYRLYNSFAGDHHYTTSRHERDVLVGKGWTYEGVGWKSGGEVGVLRQYNPNAATGTHNFTTSSNEDSTLAGYGWRREGTAWKCLSAKGRRIDGFWALSKLTGGLERYWIASDGNVARDRYVQPSEGAGYVAFARPNGTIVRGAWDNGRAQVFLADNDGRLTGANGWLVTGDYDGGRMRRYYVDGKTHTARTGHFTVGGAHYWGCGGVGYVLCGKMRMGNGMLLGNKDGVLAWGEGWCVTGEYDGGAMQRYRIDGSPGNGMRGAHLGEFRLGGKTYIAGEWEGYILRGRLFYRDGRWWRSNDDDGALEQLTTGKIGWQNPEGYPQVSCYSVVLPDYCVGEHTYVSPSVIAPDASREDCVEAFIHRAYEYLGTTFIEPFSKAPGEGVDCSGLVLQCCYACGMDLGWYNPYNHRWRPEQCYNSMNWYHSDYFMPIDPDDLQRGDLVYYSGHVAIYLGGGNIIHSWPIGGVQISSATFRPIIGAQRPFV